MQTGQLGIGSTNNIGDNETPGTLGLTVQIGLGPPKPTPAPTPGDLTGFTPLYYV
jgi:hypothetical protein